MSSFIFTLSPNWGIPIIFTFFINFNSFISLRKCPKSKSWVVNNFSAAILSTETSLTSFRFLTTSRIIIFDQ